MPLYFRAQFTPCRSVGGHPDSPLAGGVKRPVAPASPSDAVLVADGRDEQRALGLEFLEGYRLEPHRGKPASEMVDVVFSGPPAPGDEAPWADEQVVRWWRAADRALRNLFPPGPASAVVVESALHLGPLPPRGHMQFVPRVPGRGGRMRISWRQLQEDMASAIAGCRIPVRHQQASFIHERLFAIAGEPFGLARAEKGAPPSAAALLAALAELAECKKQLVGFDECKKQLADARAEQRSLGHLYASWTMAAHSYRWQMLFVAHELGKLCAAKGLSGDPGKRLQDALARAISAADQRHRAEISASSTGYAEPSEKDVEELAGVALRFPLLPPVTQYDDGSFRLPPTRTVDPPPAGDGD